MQGNDIKLSQAKKARLAAILNTIDISGNLLSAQFTNNTRLGVNVFPAEAFGGQPGSFREIETGVQYTTNANSFADIKLANPAAWATLKMSRINIDLTNSSNLISLKNLQENIATSYYNIVSLQKQIAATEINYVVIDSLFQIAQNKYNEGLVKQQDVNDTKVSCINTKESITQMEFLMAQYYTSLKILCDIPERESIEIIVNKDVQEIAEGVEVMESDLNVRNQLLQEKYAKSNFISAKAAFLPTISLQFSNSFNLFNTEFNPLSGNWINSNFIGLKFNMPIPSAAAISKKYTAKYDYQLAKKNTEQALIKANLDRTQLEIEFKKSVSQTKSNKEILELRKDTYMKNKNLYQEGLLNLEQTLNSYNAMVNADYNYISSQVNVQLSKAKIIINNEMK